MDKNFTDSITIKGAREHNLKNIDVVIPKNKLVVFTGVSGSGKSSLAFDTIYAEGQRRYVESLSAYARQFLGIMDKPDVDNITGLSPAISIDQKTTSHNPRSTVGTVTEVYDYLRLLFARVGQPHCPNCGRKIEKMSIDQIVAKINELRIGSSCVPAPRFLVLSPLVKGRKGEFQELFKNLRAKGITKLRIDGKIISINDDFLLLKNNKHYIEAVIDKFTTDISRLRESLELALRLSDGEVIVSQVLDSSLEFPEYPQKMEDHFFSEKQACPSCSLFLGEISPRLFSFNSPEGACPQCTGLGYLLKIDPELLINPELSLLEGGILPLGGEVEHDTWFVRTIKAVAQKYKFSLTAPLKQLESDAIEILLYGAGEEEFLVEGTNRSGKMTAFKDRFEGIIPRLEKLYTQAESDWRRNDIEKYMRRHVCPKCQGTRLKSEALGITIKQKNIAEIAAMSIKEAREWIQDFESWGNKEITVPIVREIETRLKFLVDVGLDYLTLERAANTLAGGEAQRIRLASQIGSGLSGVLYVLDEPSIGLHPRDNYRLIETLTKLRDLNNTVIVVEHDREMIEHADFILDFGPGAGEHGGKIIAQGTPEEIKANPQSLTGKYLSQRKTITVKGKPHNNASIGKFLTIVGAREHNLKNITVDFPLGKLVCVTGVSGSGKSTLVYDCLYQALAKHFNPAHKEKPGNFDYLRGENNLTGVILIDQSPIGRTSRSNPATYTGVFTFIRQLFAQTKEAKIRGYPAGRFSFNLKGGRCEACQGEGQIKIEMQFLPDVFVTCEVCKGKRYNQDALEIFYKGKTIADVLEMTVEEAINFFPPLLGLYEKLKTLINVGLDYIRLGQPAPTLSGGEAQRIKLATELSKKNNGQTLYILDEPTTGLHFADLEKLLWVLRELVNKGNTVIVIEHNLDVIKNADYIIDLGYEGGEKGGKVIATGTPEEIAACQLSYTGQFLKREFKR